MSAPRLYVPGLDPAAVRVELPEGEAHHVSRVLRLRAGADVRVFDGQGREWTARLTAPARRGAATVELGDEVQPVAEPAMRVTVAAGILKGDHMDSLIRDATMMGAAEIVPLVTSHVAVPRRAWHGEAALERWHRVAVASAKQSGRAVVPPVVEPARPEDVLRSHAGSTMVMFSEPSAGARVSNVADLTVPSRAALVLVGPEGGWSGAEVAAAEAAGVKLVQLGPRTIRSDAMAAVALAALWAVWSG